ncbi:WRKY transcription factor 6 [Populus alba x Populus x berolinensis]|uniref:WRKY transcription factor 6 n=1 Tax=Populus alba x Populus x berolinensis TaxID=444605 RepID=A0AAD6LSU5_9ROSI|nr:WRKY transcription factor 6 [Populus alba x Populus x berolinensis]
MELSMEWEHKTLISELSQGKELAKQLSNHLNPSSSLEARQFLVDKILSSYEKALSLLNWGALVDQQPKPTIGTVEPLHSFANSSPRSEVSDQDCKEECNKDVYKKRKIQPRWTEQVKVCSGTGLEGPLDDGYSWRKYGQKDILGANFPRGYYRCTHRHSQGCLATKQVQRSDEDHSIFEVTYRGRHTCSQASPSPLASPSPKNDCSKQSKYHRKQQQLQLQREEKPKPTEEISVNFGSDLVQVKSEDLGSKDDIFPPFSFPCTSLGNENEENNIFTESMMENNFLGSFSPTFISPATSESNYFSMSPCHMNSFGIGYPNVQTPESELTTEIISAPTSVTNSPIGDFDISIDNVDFDTTFPFDNPDFFA